MKKVLKYTGITFAVLIALGILGNILGVETAQPESEQAKAEQQAEKEAEQAAKEAEKLVEEQAKAAEEAAKQAEKEAEKAAKEAEKLAEEQAKAAEEVAKQAEKEAEKAAKEAEKLAKEQAQAAEEAAKEAEKEAAKRAEEEKKAANSWEAKIAELAKNADRPADKFYALETYMMDYSYSAKEVEQFKADIIADYTSGTYLSDITNDERMLTNIFKGYIVEKGSSNVAMKDFAFDYFQNMKYTYRGVDAVDSNAVKANESQMDRALSQM